MRECPECCGGDELGKGRREEFWVRAMRLCWYKGEREEETEEEPGKEGREGDEGVQTNQTGI